MRHRAGHRSCSLLALAATSIGAASIATSAFGSDDGKSPTHVGTASVYSSELAGRKMADGTRMDLQDDNAASKTLPLGSRAKVTNLKTGRSAIVTIQDRGPHVKGRIIDLSPSTAREIGLTPREGVTRVEVAPIPATDPGPGGRK